MRSARRNLGLALAFGALVASPARAEGIGLDVYKGGNLLREYNDDQLGCTDNGDGTSHCSGFGLTLGAGGFSVISWDLFVDSDPVVSGIAAVTNVSWATQEFTLIFNLPVAPISLSSKTGGSLAGGMTDNDGDGATVSTAPGSALYTALIDGVAYQQLYADPQAFSSGSYLSGTVPATSFGAPIPSQAGPAVATKIGIQLDFLVTPHDSASFTSNFVVLQGADPVPEPGTFALLGMGFLMLAAHRRRDR